MKFGDNASEMQPLTICEGNGAIAIKAALQQLVNNGATRADSGLNRAAQTLNNTQRDSKKVVIFFTDGVPTSSNNFESWVANAAIQSAYSMKTQDTTIYSVGIFEDADPSITNDSNNAFMHGVSSNYPNAQSYNNLGDRAEQSNYYLASDNATGLNQIFQDIFDEVTSGSGSPTQIPDGATENMSGYITFTDQLGEYMEVKDVNEVVFAGWEFSPVGDPTVSGNVTTYHFEGGIPEGANSIYPNGNLSDLIVQVRGAPM